MPLSSSSCDELEAAFIEFMTVEKSASPRTLTNYSHALNRFRSWAADSLSSWPTWRTLSPDHFRKYLFHLMKADVARPTIRLHFSAFRSFYKFLVFRQGFPKSPVADVQLPKLEKKLPVVLSVAQIESLLDAPHKIPLSKQAPTWLPFRDVAVIELFYSTGMRLSELAALNLSDLDDLSDTIRVLGKGNKERLVPVGSHANQALQKYRHEAQLAKEGKDSPLFISKLRKRLSTRSINTILKKCLAASDIPFNVTPHKLRHSFATHLTHVTKERLRTAYDAAHPRAQ